MSLLDSSPVYKPFRYPWAFGAWQKQQRVHWIPEEVPMADDVRDWNKILTPEEKNLLSQVFRFFTLSDMMVNDAYINYYMPVFKANEVLMMLSAFSNMECFDSETELLTYSGWKSVTKISYDDLIAQYNLETEEISFSKPIKIIKENYSGLMHQYCSSTTDIVVTPNHDLILMHPESRKLAKKKSYEGKWGRNYLYPSCGKTAIVSNPGDSIDALKIAVAADGTIRANCPSTNDNIRTVGLCLKKKRKIIKLISIMKSVGIEPNEIKKDNGSSVFNFRFPGNDRIKELKTLDFIKLENITKERALWYIEEILSWDGTNSKSGKRFYSSNKKAIDKFQALCVLAGVRTGISCPRKAGFGVTLPNGKYTTNTKDSWVCAISKTKWKTYPYRKEIFYDGDIFCVSVPDQNVVSRRNNKVSITGNSIHQAAYSYLLDTVGMPEVEYSTFRNYKEMTDKYNYMQSFSIDNKYEIAKTMAAFAAFTEGLQLFSSFAILLNFPRYNKMKGMGQIISWSCRDETIHCQSVIKLFHTFLEENPGLWSKKLREELKEICRTIVAHEDAFIDLAFSLGPVKGLSAEELKTYIRYIADRRLIELGIKGIYKEKVNPLPWLDEMMNAVEHANFFEQRPTEYSKAATEGSWKDAWED